MKRINLLPPEIIAGRKARQEQALLAMVFGGVVALLALVWLMLHLQVNQQRERLASAQAKAQALQVQINSLQRFALLEQAIISRVDTLSGAMTNDIGWSRLLRDVASTIPSNAWITAFTGTADEAAGGSVPAAPAPAPPAGTPAPDAPAPGAPGAPAAATPPSPGAPPAAAPPSPGIAAAAGTLPPRLGTLTFTAVTNSDFPAVATWITTFQKLGTLQNLWVPTGAKSHPEYPKSPNRRCVSPNSDPACIVNFTSTVDLSQAARSGRYQRQP